jgi:serine phosphatase RsbU (regulator of sigma subunit)/anti-sigma regulatory factor (Ser/Thr protein kinase)
VAEAVEEFKRFCFTHGLDPAQWVRIELCATEAANNAAEHGAKLDGVSLIRLEWRWEEDSLQLIVRDPADYRPPADFGNLPDDPLSERGRGHFLMKTQSDGLFHTNGPEGHAVTLSFRVGLACVHHESPADSEAIMQSMTEDLGSSYENLSALFRLSEALAESDSFDVFLTHALEQLVGLVGADGVHVARLKREVLEPITLRGQVPLALWQPQPVVAENVQGAAVRTLREQTVEFPGVLAPGDPLRSAEGSLFCCPMSLSERVLGVLTLFLGPDKPYFTAGQIRLAHTIADVLAIAMSSEEMQKERARQQRTLRELEIAADLQQRLLPKLFPSAPPLGAHGVCVSARQTGGDFFDLVTLENGLLVAVVADVMGKGISAALVGTIFRTVFHSCLDLAAQPEQLMMRMARLIYREINELEIFITAHIAVFDPHRRELRLCSAGHCPAILALPDGTILTPDKAQGLPLGIFDSGDYPVEVLPLLPGTRTLLFTDGLTEAENTAQTPVMLELKGLRRIVLERRHDSLPDFVRGVLKDIDTFCDHKNPTDDRTLLVVDYLPGP